MFVFVKDKKNLFDELETLKNQYNERDNEVLRLQELLERVQADKNKLSRRVSKLVLNGKHSFLLRQYLILCFSVEKDLLQELQKCRRTTKPPTPTASGASSGKKLSLPARLDIHLKNVEDERDMYRNETDILQKLLNERSRAASPSAARLRGRSVSPTPGSRASARRDTATSPVMQMSKRSASGGSISPTRCTVCGINRHRSSPTKVREEIMLNLICLGFRI